MKLRGFLLFGLVPTFGVQQAEITWSGPGKQMDGARASHNATRLSQLRSYPLMDECVIFQGKSFLVKYDSPVYYKSVCFCNKL